MTKLAGKPNHCSALMDRRCKNGFPVTGPCFGTGGTPLCCREDNLLVSQIAERTRAREAIAQTQDGGSQ